MDPKKLIHLIDQLMRTNPKVRATTGQLTGTVSRSASCRDINHLINQLTNHLIDRLMRTNHKVRATTGQLTGTVPRSASCHDNGLRAPDDTTQPVLHT